MHNWWTTEIFLNFDVISHILIISKQCYMSMSVAIHRSFLLWYTCIHCGIWGVPTTTAVHAYIMLPYHVLLLVVHLRDGAAFGWAPRVPAWTRLLRSVLSPIVWLQRESDKWVKYQSTFAYRQLLCDRKKNNPKWPFLNQGKDLFPNQWICSRWF